ncbi:hypothetical protein ACRAWD_11430 [Caulobacter segnis]
MMAAVPVEMRPWRPGEVRPISHPVPVRSSQVPNRPPSTLKRPLEALIRRFHLGQVGNDTVRTFLTKGYSLAICCRECPRIIEWTPEDLLEKFEHRVM